MFSISGVTSVLLISEKVMTLFSTGFILEEEEFPEDENIVTSPSSISFGTFKVEEQFECSY